MLVCINKAGAAGELYVAREDGCCRNFKKRYIVNRPAVTQPADSNIRFIPLTRGKVTIVDAADYDWLSKYKWYAHKKGAGFYAATHIGPKFIYMHRLLLNLYELPPERRKSAFSKTKNHVLSAVEGSQARTPNCHRRGGESLVVDHIDRNGLNNRRSNLRLCTYQQNIFNQRGRKGTSRYKGVHWDKEKKAWAACIGKNNKAIKLGFFDDETSAAKAYDKMAGELFGDFAYLNLS